MSLLLDALGKAEKDRLRDEVPELRTPSHTESSLVDQLVKIMALLMIMATCFIAGYFLRPNIDKWMVSTPTNETAVPVSVVSEPQQEPADAKREGATDPILFEESPSALSLDKGSASMELSVISYSDLSAVRFAMINGFVMHEGDVLASGERIKKIERSAVVLEKMGVTTKVGLNP